MGNHVTRRAFIARPLTRTASKENETTAKDPFFDKYANKELPFSAGRTMSGLGQYARVMEEADYMHLLRRTMFGLTKDSLNAITGKSLSDAVDFLIDNPKLPYSAPQNCYQNTYADTEGVPYGQPWVYFNAPDNADPSLYYQRVNYSFKPWWMGVMMEQSTHIMEKMTLFWANHFGTQTKLFNTPRPIWQHYYTLRTQCLGNFRTLIKAITIDPHMLKYLNGDVNTASAPDENYARELQELFTVGKGLNSAYTEDDIKQAAKILTGWRRDSGSDGYYFAYFNDKEHDSSDKQFSSFYNNRIIKGRTGADGQYETDDLLDMILANDEVAKYICRCLYRWFVYYVIDDAAEANVITPLAQIFRNGNYEIAPVLKALFKSDHFFDPLNRGCIIKSPVDLYVGFTREFSMMAPLGPPETRYAYWLHFKTRCDEIDQNIGDPPGVAGWSAYHQAPVFYQAWINSDTIQKRVAIPSIYATENGFATNSNPGGIKIDPLAFNKQFPNPEDPNKVVDYFSRYLLPQPVSDKELNVMKAKLITISDGVQDYSADHYWTDAWNKYMFSMNDQNAGPGATAIVTRRLYDLITYIIGLEEYQLY